ncbi:hypothetical protein QBC37DRAFT_484275 [Rhypophila decipiens]|uniref:Lysozyme n=1 Tax=Rhypophila decipiens TaxID=261697 RepID=A0AAN6Y438_9PEZI|nr:hypothetical protein QBC37DRAFT_484275 [Rhypophila decipiens]
MHHHQPNTKDIMLAIIPLLISAVAAYTLPPNLSDGLYHVQIDADGNEVHEILSTTLFPPTTNNNISARAPEPETLDSNTTPVSGGRYDVRSTIMKRQVWCGCGYTLDRGQCDTAVNTIKHQLGFWGASFLGAYSSVSGGVVAFACALNGPAFANDPLVTEDLRIITRWCGRYIAGTRNVGGQPNGFNSVTIGYMRYHAGLDFCGTARNSNSDHC